ncbi:MAG: 5'-nucleotidase C-terminal domain-containing protein [Leucobacter sp.]
MFLSVAVLASTLLAPLSPASLTVQAHANPGPEANTDAGTTTVQVLTINDFHGRLEADPWRSPGIAGAAVLSGAVDKLGAEHPKTIFASAGDNIGASTFTSFIAQDAPTIDALVRAGLDVSAVGNHEFDQGSADLIDRVLPRYGDLAGGDGRAYGLGANVRDRTTDNPILDEYAIVERDGIKIGFIGTVTEQTATSVNPGLIEEIEFTSQLDAANRVASEIDELVDATVLLTHDGARTGDCDAVATEQSVFGTLAREASPLIDAVVSAHTHQAYACTIADRPVIQADHYGAALGRLLLEFDTSGETPQLSEASADLVRLAGETYFAPDPAVEAIVDAAVEQADTLGREPVGRISADILRGGTPPGTDRSVESALGNLIADITQQSIAGADIGVMNAGGLREDLIYVEGAADGSGGLLPPGTVTYRDVANVQPFANTMMTVQLTGAQVKELLEQQWTVATVADQAVEQKRHLSVSAGLSYTYRPDAPLGSRITSISLHGAPIDPAASYTVATISFLANGGDRLSVLPEGSNHTDTGLNDLEMTVDYFRAQERAGLAVEPPLIGRAIAEAPTPEPSPQPTPEPAPHPAPGPGGSGSTAPSQLPATGADAHSELLVLGLLLGATGIVILGASLRRTHGSVPGRSRSMPTAR